jgi:SulP family sulfate permease
MVFSHVNTQPMHTMEKSGFIKKAGAENFRPHIDDAIARAAELAASKQV